MITYLVLNIVFVLIVCLCLGIKAGRPQRQTIMLLGALFVLTFVFDSLLIVLHIVAYAQDHLLGLRIGVTPVEDYFYPLLAVLVVPHVWRKGERRHD